MPADFTIVAGDTVPAYADTLQFSNKELVNLAGATVTLTMRSLTATGPVALTGEVSVINAAKGEVAYTFSEQDTAVPGNYMASWLVVFDDGAKMTFPTDGYVWFEIQPNLTAPSKVQLVNLGELKEKLFIPANDRQHDDWFLGEIEAVQPLIEEVTGPILPQIYDERFDGGSNIISLLHPPTYGWGTNPVLTLLGASEFRGPIEYPLSLVPNPVYGSIYSVELNPRMGELTRRTAGGGTIAFMPGRNSVRCIYEAGQSPVPANVRRAAVETIRWWWSTSEATGAGARTRADEENTGGPPHVALPYHVTAMLAPTRRHPSLG